MSGILPTLFQLVSGAGSTSGTGALTLIAAQSGGGMCISSLQLGRTDSGASALTVTLNDTANTVFVLPPQADGGGVLPLVFDAPLVVSNNTALTVTVSSGVSTFFASAQGFLRN